MDELQKLVQQHLDKYFSFFKSLGFTDLIEEETYFICPWYFLKNDKVQLSIQCQGENSLLHLCVDRYDFRLLEPENTKLKEIEKQFDYCYNTFYVVNRQQKKQSLNEKEKALFQLKKLETEWLDEMSAVLLRHSNVLKGDLTLLNENWTLKYEKEKNEKDQKRLERKLFSLELYQFPEDEIDPFFDEKSPYNCELEFADFDEVREYLEKHQEVKIYRILDYNLNEIKIGDRNK